MRTILKEQEGTRWNWRRKDSGLMSGSTSSLKEWWTGGTDWARKWCRRGLWRLSREDWMNWGKWRRIYLWTDVRLILGQHGGCSGSAEPGNIPGNNHSMVRASVRISPFRQFADDPSPGNHVTCLRIYNWWWCHHKNTPFQLESGVNKGMQSKKFHRSNNLLFPWIDCFH